VTLRTLVLSIVALFAAHSLFAQTTPSAQDIVKAVIAKKESDKKHCEKHSYLATTNKIKYNKQMQPDEVTITKRKAYFWGDKTAEEIFSIEKEGEMLTPDKIREEVAELNEKWLDEQKDKEKKEGSEDNSVDPLTLEGMAEYDYYQIGKGDSSFAVVPSTVATAGGPVDQSIEKLMSYCVIMARSKTLDSRHLNATYWIDAKTYGVIRTEFTPAKLPHFVEMLDFQMDNGVIVDNDSTLYLPRRFELKGKAGFLFFKGRFGVIEEYGSYKCENAIADSLFNQRYFYSGGTK
jgi:hypothetical protein